MQWMRACVTSLILFVVVVMAWEFWLHLIDRTPGIVAVGPGIAANNGRIFIVLGMLFLSFGTFLVTR